jgi:hypothetical protein
MDRKDEEHLMNLRPPFRRKVQAILERLTDLGFDPRIAESLRTVEQQRRNVLRGVSWTMRSKHLPKYGYARAVDIVDRKKGWRASEVFWFTLGRLAVMKGLGWGGLWGLPPAERRALEFFITDTTFEKWLDSIEEVSVQGRRGVRDKRTGKVYFRGRDPAHVEEP